MRSAVWAFQDQARSVDAFSHVRAVEEYAGTDDAADHEQGRVDECEAAGEWVHCLFSLFTGQSD
jgi:hypothetical protein